MKSLMTRRTNPTGSEDGPEEGEIVSDDFEDISDESIIFTPSNGKSLSRSDHLHALSLSSVSVTDMDEPPVEKRIKRRKSYSEKHTRRRKRSRRKLVESDSSEEETTLDRKLKLQLKAAIQVDVEEAHKNSLRTRLRAMVQSNSGPESDAGTIKQTATCLENEVKVPVQDLSVIVIESGSESVSAPEIVYKASEEALSSTETILSAPDQNKSDSVPIKDEVDNELIQLRIEALKTALNNKFANRKRRKKDNLIVQTSDDTNKENTNHNNDKDKVKTDLKVEIPQTSPQLSSETPQSPEEDEDVLRALLLASMSKKITSVEPELTKMSVQQINTKPVPPTNNKVITSGRGRNNILNNFKINYVKKVINSKKNVVNKAMGNTKLVKMPQVKPLIINLNSDSDSDLDISSSPEKQPEKTEVVSEKENNVESVENNVESVENKVVKNAIESSVDKFLKEQRAKVESEVLTSSKTVVNTALSIDDTKKIVTAKSVQNNTKISSISNKNAVSTLLAKTKGKHTQTLNKTTITTKNFKFTDLEKSALKFLPESKREEYKQLQNLLRLKKAELKKPRVRRISQRVDNNLKITLVNKIESAENNSKVTTENTQSIANKFSKIASGDKANTHCNSQVVLPHNKSSKLLVVPKIIKNNIKPVNKNINNKIVLKKENTGQFLNTHEKSYLVRGDIHKQRKSDALLLHNTLKQMQIRKNGRLQIQERYKGLLPLVKKINQVSKEQKSWDQHVKRLLEQLAEARKHQEEVHEKMSSLVTELTVNKERTDLSLAKVSTKPKINKNLITSTPMKPTTSNMSIDISAVNSTNSFMSTSQSATDQEDINTIDSTLVGAKSCVAKSQSVLNTWEQSTKLDINVSKQKDGVAKPVGDVEPHIIVDPNDIDNIIKKTEEKVAVLEKRESFESRTEKVRYVSPLDSVRRKESIDPFAIMCPFEVMGTCKDTECTFKHLPK